jgi:hypothetical protein
VTATYPPAPASLEAGPHTVSPYGALAAPGHAPAPAYAPYPQHHQYQPQVQHVQQRSGSGSTAVVGLVVVLLALLAAAAGYFIAKGQAPNADEITRYQQVAASEGFRAGQYNGIAEGRNFAVQSQRRIAQYRAAIAKQRAWNNGYRKGMNQGRQRPVRSYSGYSGYSGYRGYSAPRYSGPSSNQRAISSALSSAQALANRTGAPVDVEIYP